MLIKRLLDWLTEYNVKKFSYFYCKLGLMSKLEDYIDFSYDVNSVIRIAPEFRCFMLLF